MTINGTKVFYLGLTILLAVPELTGDIVGLPVKVLGALVTIIGVLMVLFNK